MEPDRERLKLILKNLKSLVNALESEIYSDLDAYTPPLGGETERNTQLPQRKIRGFV